MSTVSPRILEHCCRLGEDLPSGDFHIEFTTKIQLSQQVRDTFVAILKPGFTGFKAVIHESVNLKGVVCYKLNRVSQPLQTVYLSYMLPVEITGRTLTLLSNTKKIILHYSFCVFFLSVFCEIALIYLLSFTQNLT